MGLADKLRSLDQAAVRAARPTAVAPTPVTKPTVATKAAPIATPDAPAATQAVAVRPSAVVTPVTGPATPAAGRVPRLRALGWRLVALVAAVLAVGGRRGLLGPAGAVVVGLVLTIWWGPLFYVGLGIVTAGIWIWALRVQPHEPTDNNY